MQRQLAKGATPPSPPPTPQCCMGAILEAAQRGSHKEVMSGLYNARAGVLSLLPAIAGRTVSQHAATVYQQSASAAVLLAATAQT
jgi:hypothetical protein